VKNQHRIIEPCDGAGLVAPVVIVAQEGLQLGAAAEAADPPHVAAGQIEGPNWVLTLEPGLGDPVRGHGRVS
jgi:hypothetical protein